jgi:hypothetical protein
MQNRMKPECLGYLRTDTRVNRTAMVWWRLSVQTLHRVALKWAIIAMLSNAKLSACNLVLLCVPRA